MLLTILKVVAGLAVLGIVILVLFAVVSGAATAIRERRTRKDRHEESRS